MEKVRFDGMIVVRPDKWRIANDKIPTFYMLHSAVKKTDKPSPSKLPKTFDENFASIKAVKDQGNAFFKTGNFENAKEIYAKCIADLNVCVFKIDMTLT